ncbi:hypothetical protein [Streptomyces sp. NBRC 109706]|uniref:hypothetical protein n=1 Tax=Streptomyces sp. NBRC 109706 TaxID=1550035 RepID=UPI000784B69C|nr:hypothetical protein [Streptomyces sp. NBRC 109706]
MNEPADHGAERDTGPPDALMLAHQKRQRRHLRARLLVSVPLAALTTGVGVGLLLVSDWPWPWTLAGLLSALTLVGCLNLGSPHEPERPRPGTPLEAAVVVGVEITTWSFAAHRTHTARLIGRPIGSTTGQLVHGYREFDAESGCPFRPGMLFGFRRHPGMRHLVHIEGRQHAVELLGLRDRRPWGRAALLDAVVESVTVSGPPDGDWWPTTVTVRHAGLTSTDTRRRLPEELATLEPGTPVRIAHLPASTDSALLPPVV